VAGIVGRNVEPLAFHRAAAAARDPAQLELKHFISGPRATIFCVSPAGETPNQ
jgi:hypothetical protein